MKTLTETADCRGNVLLSGSKSEHKSFRFEVERMNEKQKDTVEKFAAHIKHTNPNAIGVAYLVLGCGCIQGGPFDHNGDQSGPVEHFLTQSNGDSIKICQECMKDGGPPERVTESLMLFFEPESLTNNQREWLCNKIFCEVPPGD
jgi:hypothetical protein